MTPACTRAATRVPRCLERDDFSFQNVAGAQPYRWLRCQQDVPSVDCDFDVIVWGGVAERHFDFAGAFGQAHAHHAIRLAQLHYGGVQQIFEASGLGKSFAARRGEDFVRPAFANDAAAVENNHAFAEGVDFVAGVRYVKDWNFLRGIPHAQVVHN